MTDKDKDKIRVYELAKELKLDSRRLIDLLHRLNVDGIKNHMSTVEPEAVQTVRDIMVGKLPPASRPTPAPASRPASEPTAAPLPRPPVPKRPPTVVEAPTAAPAPVRPTPPPPPRPPAREPAAPGRSAYPDRDRRGPSDWRSGRPPGQTGTPPSSGADPRRSAPGARPPRPPMSGSGSGYAGRPSSSGDRPPYAPRPAGSGAPRPSGPRPGGPAGPSRGPGSGPRPNTGTGPRPSSGAGPRPGVGARPTGRPMGAPPPGAAAPSRPGKDANRRTGGGKDRRTHSGPPERRARDWDEERFGNKRRSKSAKALNRKTESTMPPVQRHVVLSGPVAVKDLADQLGLKATEVIKRLIGLGVMVGVNQELDRETAVILATEFGAEVEERATVQEREELLIQGEEDAAEALEARPPVVTVMGHVDHGKTSLLDKIRTTRVTQTEAGGITQHIGASVVEWQGRSVVFLDTPGHEAFTSMRARGAQVTDVAVLVVAANDGVMPQTVEAINHAKAANVPIVVAINKIDLPDANPDRVRTELSEHGLIPESWGGETIMVPVSARTGEGLDNLLESLILQTDILELRANPNRPAQGTVIEAKLDKGRGPVATVLVKRGTLRVGDVFLSGSVFGRVRALINDRGMRVQEAAPSMPVEVLGFNQLPEAGDDFVILADERQAKDIADARAERHRKASETPNRGVSLEDLQQRLKDESMKDLNLVIKADVHGSAEALAQSVAKLSNDEVRIRVLHMGVGSITESDVMLAQASGAIVIGFGVATESKARQLADKERVDIRHYRIIYEVIDDLKNALSGMLAPKYQELVLGRAEVREVFRVPKIGAVAGCYVLEGKIARSAKVRVVRDGTVIHEGAIGSLRRFKDDVREVQSSFECGVGLERFNDIKTGDIFEIYVQEEVKGAKVV